jgi:hypothetical protein
MRKTALACLGVFLAFACLPDVHAVGKAKVEVLYMNHGPLQETLGRIKKIFSDYGEKIEVTWYDFDTKEAEEFMAKKGVRRHIPLVIWIDGKPKSTLGDREVTFAGFPTGSGPASFQGKWTMEDLRMSLDQATLKR